MCVLPRFEIVRRMRPVDLVAPGDVRLRTSAAGRHPMPAVAPYVAAVSDIDGPACEVALHLGGLRLATVWRDGSVSLSVGDRPVRSRRFARSQSPSRLGISLTGTHLTAWADESGSWVARARYDLVDDLDPRDESVLAGLAVEAPGAATHAGGFGQLGLRDVRFVSDADGTPIREGGDLWLTATSAGPGFFDTAHTSVWRLDPSTLELAHSGRPVLPPPRPVRVSSATTRPTWCGTAAPGWSRPARGETSRSPRRELVVVRHRGCGSPWPSPGDDLLRGTHVLDTRELPLPTDGFTSIATWDPTWCGATGSGWSAS